MPTPYQRPHPLSAPAADRRAARRVLCRPTEWRVVAGVCSGLADHLGWDVRLVRLGFVMVSVPGGAGLVAYLFLWALAPSGPGPVAATVPSVVADRPDTGRRDASRALLGGVVLMGLGLLVAAHDAGIDLRLGVLVPLLVVALGAVLAWSQLDDAQRGRWLGGPGGTRPFSAARLLVGGALAIAGLVTLASRGRSLAATWDIALAAVAVVGGTVLVAAPWVLKLWADLRREQTERARATERADIAAHLHDSVLQTLALIQRSATDPAAVAQLARAQERELRAWLYAGPSGSEATLAAAATAVAHEVEDRHGIPVDLVTAGDRPLDAAGAALVQALREALLNAVRHGQPPVSAYLEVGPAGVEAFVRDHGPGFDLEEVPGDRFGVRQSILGRMARHGGTARLRRLERGTEVALALPPPTGQPGQQGQPAQPGQPGQQGTSAEAEHEPA